MSQSTDPSGPYHAADDQEEIYFDGSPQLRSRWGVFLTLITAGLLLILLGMVSMVRAWHWPWWIIVVLWLAGLLLPGIVPVWLRTIRYRIGNYRIDFEHGILTRHIDTLELWHVDDMRLSQTLLQRMLRVGTINIYSHDDTTPNLALTGLPRPVELFNTLRQRVIAVKRQRGVIKMDIG